MDSDQHRQKRCRTGSTAGDNDPKPPSDIGNDDSKQANPDQTAPLSTPTTALQNCSIRDDDLSTTNKTSQQPLQQVDNPTPAPSFLSHPSFQLNGGPNASFHFDPVVDQTKINSHSTPAPTLHTADTVSHEVDHHPQPPRLEHLNGQSTQSGLGSQPTSLPLHGPRRLQPLGELIAGPSRNQVERDVNKPNGWSGTSRQRMSRPSPIYVPPPAGTPGVMPALRTDNAALDDTSTASSTSGHVVQRVPKQMLTSDKNSAQPGFPADGVRPVDGAKHPYRAMTSNSAAATFPYPSIYPANERRFDGKWPLDADHPPSPPYCPLNHYTSPNRVQNAALVASRKRKRGWPALPPPAYIYTRTNDPNFNIFGGILLYPELCFALAVNLPVDGLLSLYAISKDFHTIIDTRFATVILGQSLRKCPESTRIFPFRCYKYLCRPDPAPRIPHPHPAKEAAGEIRQVPSFRWLKMVLFRDKVCHEILTIMAEDGVPLPSRCELALKKMWFLLDIPDNARRIGYMHLQKLMTDLDLYFTMCFIVKLDLRFNDPVAPNRYHGLRKIILTQRGLLPLWRTLKRSSLLTRQDVLRLWVITKHKPPPEEEGLPMFGVPGDQIGKIRMEYWGERSMHDSGKPCTFLLRPDQLLMREIIRRKMVFSKHFLRSLLWGYVNIVTMEDYPPRPWTRRIQELDEEYEEEDECGGYEPTCPVRDDLLDLRVKKPISMLVASKDEVQDRSWKKKKQDEFLDECMKWYKEETSTA